MHTLHLGADGADAAAAMSKKLWVIVVALVIGSFAFLGWQLTFGEAGEVTTYLGWAMAATSLLVVWVMSRVGALHREASMTEIQEEMDLLAGDMELREYLAELYATQGNRIFTFQLDDIRRVYQERQSAAS